MTRSEGFFLLTTKQRIKKRIIIIKIFSFQSVSSATWAPIKAQNAWVEFAANLEWRSAHRWAMYKWTAPDLPSFHGQSEPKMSLSKAPMPGISWVCVKFLKSVFKWLSQWFLFYSLPWSCCIHSFLYRMLPRGRTILGMSITESDPKSAWDEFWESDTTLMEEIRLTTWDVENPVNNGMNYQPQLVIFRRISEPSTVAPENRWLEYDCFLLGPGLSSRAKLWVSGNVTFWESK